MLENKGLEVIDNEELDEIINMTDDDIIAKLMSDEDEIPEATMIVDRLRIPVTLKGLRQKEIFRIRKECTKIKKARGQQIKELDEEEFNAKLIEKASISPNWNDAKLLKHHKASDGAQIIKKKFLAGEMEFLSDKVLELSGFDDELKEVEKIKN